MLQIIIINNHMNGKDTHVRGLKLLGPIEYVSLCVGIFGGAHRCFRPKLQPHEEPFPSVAPQFKMYQCIR